MRTCKGCAFDPAHQESSVGAKRASEDDDDPKSIKRRLKREIKEEKKRIRLAPNGASSLDTLKRLLEEKVAIDLQILNLELAGQEGSAKGADKYDIVEIMRRRWNQKKTGALFSTPEEDIGGCENDIQRILHTEFDLDDIVQYKGYGEVSHPLSYEIPKDKEKAIMDFYSAYGFLHVTGVMSKHECERAILEIIREVIGRQGFKKEFQLSVPVRDGEIKINTLTDAGLEEFEKNEQEILKFFTKTSYSAQERLKLGEAFPMHQEFGACTDASNMHMEYQWKLRQNPKLICLWKMVYGVEEVLPTINRAIQKLPNKGVREFCHLDLSPAVIVNNEYSSGAAGGTKLSLTEGGNRFSFVPGSNTPEFAKWFSESYGKMRGKLTKKDEKECKFQINEDEEDDPCSLWKFLRNFELRQGAMALWHPHTLHNAKKNDLNGRILFGDYNCAFVGKDPAVTKAEIVKCLENGTIPLTWPSGDPIVQNGMPKKMATNFPKQITARLSKLDQDDRWVKTNMLTQPVTRPDGTVESETIMRVFDPSTGRDPIPSFKTGPVSERLLHPTLTPYTRDLLGLKSEKFPYRDAETTTLQ
tara:strand:- start:91 stop:1845 length:1755 start_codon:yes stop_codon:yes gene_type:complete